MANDMKSGIGFLIPGAGVIGFFTSLFLGEFLISIIIAISGILVWFLYMFGIHTLAVVGGTVVWIIYETGRY